MKLVAIVSLFLCTTANATCIGSYAQCNAATQYYYGQTYQQYEQNQQQQQQNAFNQPVYQTYNQPQVNQNGFDRYGHYHTAGY